MVISRMGAKSWCSDRLISRMLFGTTTTILLGSGMSVAGVGTFDVGVVVGAACRNAEGGPYGR